MIPRCGLIAAAHELVQPVVLGSEYQNQSAYLSLRRFDRTKCDRQRPVVTGEDPTITSGPYRQCSACKSLGVPCERSFKAARPPASFLQAPISVKSSARDRSPAGGSLDWLTEGDPRLTTQTTHHRYPRRAHTTDAQECTRQLVLSVSDVQHVPCRLRSRCVVDSIRSRR